jgi:hypothetical protein
MVMEPPSATAALAGTLNETVDEPFVIVPIVWPFIVPPVIVERLNPEGKVITTALPTAIAAFASDEFVAVKV